VAFEVLLQPCPDPALHAATEKLDQRPKQPEPPLRVHLPVPAHDGFVTLGGEGQPPGGLHRRACGDRTQPVRPFELGDLNDHLHARLPHVCKESRAQPDGSRCEQLDVGHGRVERGLVARVGDRVEDQLQRRGDANVSGDVGHPFRLATGSQDCIDLGVSLCERAAAPALGSQGEDASGGAPVGRTALSSGPASHRST